SVGNGEAVAVGGERARKVALRHLDVTDLSVGHREVALPVGVVGLGFRQPNDYVVPRFVRFKRTCQVPLREKNIADPFIADAKIKLPAGIAGVPLGQPVGDRRCVPIDGKRRTKIATLHLDVAGAELRPINNSVVDPGLADRDYAGISILSGAELSGLL